MPRPWQWDELAEPRGLVQELAREASVQIAGLDTIPHDLWPAANLPSLAWTDRMTLVLAGFGLTFQWQDQPDHIRLVPLPQPKLLARSYPVTLSQAKLDDLAAQFPHARFEHLASGFRFQGTQEEHERLRQLLQQSTGERRTTRRNARTVHTLRSQ